MLAKLILTDPEKCQGCKRCELQCAIEKSEGKTLLTAIKEQQRPRIRVIGNTQSIPNICRHCDGICIANCPTKAIQRTPEGAVVIDEEKCVKCLLCLGACPFDVPRVLERTVMKCDLCISKVLEGRVPACVEGCPVSALKFEMRETPIDRRLLLSQAFALPPRRYDLTLRASESPKEIMDRAKTIARTARLLEVTASAKRAREKLGLAPPPGDAVDELSKLVAATMLSDKMTEIKIWTSR